jgi:hypothetical protein
MSGSWTSQDNEYTPIDSQPNVYYYDKDMTPKQIVTAVIIVVSIAILGGSSYYFYRQYQNTQNLLKNPAEAAKIEQAEVMTKVTKLVELPNDEMPQIATISDIDKLANQPFFNHAQNGDKVLFFSSSKKAILYRPSTNKIIEMSQVNSPDLASTTPAPAQNPASTPQTYAPTQIPTVSNVIKVAIYNGTTVAKLAANVQQAVTTKLGTINVVKVENAAHQDYAKSIVVDVSGTQQANAQTIATLIGADVSPLPVGELRPDAELLIIIGKNYIQR